MPMVKKTVKKMVPPEGYDNASVCTEIDGRCSFKFVEVIEDVWVDDLVEYA